MSSEQATLALQRAWSLLEQGDRAAARELWEPVCDVALREPAALQLFGAVALRLHEPAAARVRLQKAIRLAPTDPQNHLLLGLAQRRLDRLGAAAQAFRTALRHRPGWPDAAYNLSQVLEDLDRTDEAIRVVEEALKSAPEDADLWNQLGLARVAAERFDDSLVALERAVELEPAHGPFRANLGQERLRSGDPRGWEALEARLTFAPNLQPPDTQARPWQGESLDGRSILIWDEQGLGDTVQFAGLARALTAEGATVHLRCRSQAVGLLQTLEGIEAVWSRDADLPETDYHLPVGSLPYRSIHRLRSADPTAQPEPPAHPEPAKAYLTAPALDPADREWLEALGPGPRIGIAWTGNPAHTENRRRTIPTKVLRKWMELDGIRWVSLQRGTAEEPRFRHPGLAVPGAERLGDLVRTAGWIQALDLIVSVDSLPIHLAGATGAPAWLLLDRIGDWRWGRPAAEHSIYPSVTLFRQTERGDWAGIGRRIASELANGDLVPNQRVSDP